MSHLLREIFICIGITGKNGSCRSPRNNLIIYGPVLIRDRPLQANLNFGAYKLKWYECNLIVFKHVFNKYRDKIYFISISYHPNC